MTKINKNFPISNYLENKHKKKPGNYYHGICKACGKVVAWKKDKLINHKMSKNKICSNISDADQDLFRQYITENYPDSTSPSQAISHIPKATQTLLTKNIDILTSQEKKKIDESILAFFVQESIPLSVADSKAFKEMIAALRPVYAEFCPSSKILREWIDGKGLEVPAEEE